MLAIGANFGWRKGEVLPLRVSQVDLLNRMVVLILGTTKNDEGRKAAMTFEVLDGLREACAGKQPEDFVLTREEGTQVRDFRGGWRSACCKAKLGCMVCPDCKGNVDDENRCERCSKKWRAKELVYRARIFHDLRRTGARNLRRLGVAEGVDREDRRMGRAVFSSATTSSMTAISGTQRDGRMKKLRHSRPQAAFFRMTATG